MQKSEMKLLFYLLENRENVNKPLRTISETTGMSLGSVQAKFHELAETGFIVDTSKGKAFGFSIPDGCAPVYISTAKPVARKRGRPAKP